MLKSEFQHQFWVTKKAVQRKLGTKEDENIVASDGELDAKIELFRSVADSCSKLYRIIDQYQERVCILAQEENSLGKFLREVGKESPTTGRLMSSTGKAVSYCGQQRITIRVPLLRLHHDVQTFKGRAIADTHNTIQAMEKERTEYRAALSWMKSVSIQLDPDTGRGLEKFRKAQRHVKSAKTKFDKYTLDCLEKIDLLAAARCNMFSHALAGYQNAMLQFAKKTDETYKMTLTCLSKDPHYNFSVLKELTQANPEEVTKETTPPADNMADDDQMLFFQDEYTDEETTSSKVGTTSQQKADEDDDEELLAGVSQAVDQLLADVPHLERNPNGSGGTADLLGLQLDDEFSDFLSAPAPFLPSSLLSNPLADAAIAPGAVGATITDGEPMDKPDKPTDLLGSLLQNLSHKSSQESGSRKPPKEGKTTGKDLSGWYQLFAELDPLSNPDAIPSKADAPHNSLAA